MVDYQPRMPFWRALLRPLRALQIPWSDCAAVRQPRSEGTATGTRPSPYVDRANLPIPPKTTIELYKRTDPEHIKIWDTALRKEWDGLCEREVFEHDLTKQQLYDRGILQQCAPCMTLDEQFQLMQRALAAAHRAQRRMDRQHPRRVGHHQLPASGITYGHTGI
eukprot:SAG25_NODE_81_length_16694_cov_8.663332_14_plen_164_part_00